MATSVAYTELQFVLSAVMCWVQGNVKFQVRLSDVNAFPFKSLMSVDNDAVNCVNLDYSSAANNKDCKHLYVTDIIY